MFKDIYKEKRVFVTGHTGFKGSWLVLWLLNLGAQVVGYSLEPPTEPNHYDLLSLPHESIFDDIRDLSKVCQLIQSLKPDIVFISPRNPSFADPTGTQWGHSKPM